MATGPPMGIPGPMPSSFDDNADFYNERVMHKVGRKIKEEPLIPLGIGLTVFAFVNAYRALRKGDSKQANRMFRARVYAQGFTVVAMVAGSMYYSKDRAKTKELRQLQEQRNAEEKRAKWIRELEARDEEEQNLKNMLQEKVRAATLAEPGKAEEQQASAESGTGGILGKMGLWSKGEDAVKAEKEPFVEKRERKENPRSSLGAIGEIINSGKK